MKTRCVGLARIMRVIASLSWLTLKVLAVLYLGRGDIQAFLYQNF